jgi:hypothetical protein
MRSIGLLLLVSVAAFGQRSGNNTGFNTNSYARPNTFGSITGFGNVVFPGTGHAPIVNHPLPSTTFGGATRLGTSVPAGGRRFHGGSSVVYVPYAVGVPMYAEPSGPPMQMYYPQQPAAPPVVINQYFVPETARPVVREYATDANGGIRVYGPEQSVSVEPAVLASENPTYLIAFKDHTIYAALAYWLEGGTLHYVTNQNTHNQVSLDLVDRELSGRLNRERGVDFRLPPPAGR